MKTPILTDKHAGRLRYLDLGFFTGSERGVERVLTTALLAPLAGLRPPQRDKRSLGHLLVLGGSRSYPGAVLMTGSFNGTLDFGLSMDAKDNVWIVHRPQTLEQKESYATRGRHVEFGLRWHGKEREREGKRNVFHESGAHDQRERFESAFNAFDLI